MASLQQILFVDGVIADKIGTSPAGDLWAAAMDQDLYLFDAGNPIKKMELSQTHQSKIIFGEEQIHYHHYGIDIDDWKVSAYHLPLLCDNDSMGKLISKNHTCTNMEWATEKSLVMASFELFHPRNQQTFSGEAYHYLVGISTCPGNLFCKKLAQHPRFPCECLVAGNKWMVAYWEGLRVWDTQFQDVKHHLRFEQNVGMDHIFLSADEAYLFLVNAAGKVFQVSTTNWTIKAEWFLKGYTSKNPVAVSAACHLFGFANNEGDCHVYTKNEKGYAGLLHEKFPGIITAIAFCGEDKMIIGLNGPDKKGTGMYKFIE